MREWIGAIGLELGDDGRSVSEVLDADDDESFGAPPAFFPPSVSAWVVGSETICLLVGMLVQPFGRRPEFGVRATVFRGGNTRGF